MQHSVKTAEHYSRLQPSERVVTLRSLRGELQRQLRLATEAANFERQDSLVAVLALLGLAIPEAATQCSTSTVFVFKEAIVALSEIDRSDVA
ncbi:hypothetical protein ACCT14_10400 [Rhizobium brockwellii]|uniref:hypothetical protein n=1 Tax=Rhizobium brockwellii TaxID=3019932 RepID=UPI003F99526E